MCQNNFCTKKSSKTAFDFILGILCSQWLKMTNDVFSQLASRLLKPNYLSIYVLVFLKDRFVPWATCIMVPNSSMTLLNKITPQKI